MPILECRESPVKNCDMEIISLINLPELFIWFGLMYGMLMANYPDEQEKENKSVSPR